jgi:hypothetical protein
VAGPPHPEDDAFDQTCFSSPKFARTLNWRLPFLWLNFRIVVHAYASISPTGIRKTKPWYIPLIYNIFTIFNLSAPNIRLLQGQVIHSRITDESEHRVTSDLFGIFLSAWDENQNYTHWELFTMRCCVFKI